MDEKLLRKSFGKCVFHLNIFQLPEHKERVDYEQEFSLLHWRIRKVVAHIQMCINRTPLITSPIVRSANNFLTLSLFIIYNFVDILNKKSHADIKKNLEIDMLKGEIKEEGDYHLIMCSQSTHSACVILLVGFVWVI